MKLYNYLNYKKSIFGVLGVFLALTSCGSYQYASYDSDGIYGEPEQDVEYIVNYEEDTKEGDNSAYYKNYFKEKVTELDNMEGDVIFTDIDSYQGAYDVENDSLEYQEGYAGWGYDSDQITVNIYNSPNYNRFWYPYYYDYGWYNNWNFGYSFYGYYDYWYSPFYIGWNRHWYSYYGYPYYFGNPYYYGYNNYYYFGNRNSRTYAYNASRRGSVYSSNNVSGISRRNAITNRRSSINSRATNLRNNATRSSSSMVNATRSSRYRVNSQPTRSSRVGTSSSNRSRSATTRSSRSSTSRSSSARSNNNSSRRSNNVSSSNRSSSSSSTRSSGRSNSSRRNN